MSRPAQRDRGTLVARILDGCHHCMHYCGWSDADADRRGLIRMGGPSFFAHPSRRLKDSKLTPKLAEVRMVWFRSMSW
jgi:hypothetical protein